jgi:hypothetical protein
MNAVLPLKNNVKICNKPDNKNTNRPVSSNKNNNIAIFDFGMAHSLS